MSHIRTSSSDYDNEVGDKYNLGCFNENVLFAYTFVANHVDCS